MMRGSKALAYGHGLQVKTTTDSLPSPGWKATVLPSTAFTSENFGAVAPIDSSSALTHVAVETNSRNEATSLIVLAVLAVLIVLIVLFKASSLRSYAAQ